MPSLKMTPCSGISENAGQRLILGDDAGGKAVTNMATFDDPLRQPKEATAFRNRATLYDLVTPTKSAPPLNHPLQ
ncbi:MULTISPECIES: hypothetical protein [unclassified Rhizobium]|uniref:hypothetical protein n=1 Tax=unclassified Rhizobium TaxID=2613769 RepID=UPI000AD61894|nr:MULTISPECIES: hypothetical protein [unclassified Rhizobium]